MTNFTIWSDGVGANNVMDGDAMDAIFIIWNDGMGANNVMNVMDGNDVV